MTVYNSTSSLGLVETSTLYLSLSATVTFSFVLVNGLPVNFDLELEGLLRRQEEGLYS